MAKVLVTGANGFLGSWLVRRLVQDGHQIRILARPQSDLRELRGIEFEKSMGDVTNLESLIAATEGVDAVFHLAGVIAYKRADREKMEIANVQGTANVLKSLEGRKGVRLVHVSSVVAIGAGYTPDQILNEESTFNVADLHLGYFDTKRDAEILVRQAYLDKKVDAVIVNPSTTYGPGDSRKGSRNTQLKVARGEFPFYTKGGVNVIHVEDCVEGMVAAWKKGRSGERYILAGENLTIKELFEAIAQAAGVEAPKRLLPSWALFTLGWLGDRATDVGMKAGVSVENAWTSQLYNWFDNSKAKSELGLRPRPAREAIKASVRWSKEKGLL